MKYWISSDDDKHVVDYGFLLLKNNASKLLLAIMESRRDSENAEKILLKMRPNELVMCVCACVVFALIRIPLYGFFFCSSGRCDEGGIHPGPGEWGGWRQCRRPDHTQRCWTQHLHPGPPGNRRGQVLSQWLCPLTDSEASLRQIPVNTGTVYFHLSFSAAASWYHADVSSNANWDEHMMSCSLGHWGHSTLRDLSQDHEPTVGFGALWTPWHLFSF